MRGQATGPFVMVRGDDMKFKNTDEDMTLRGVSFPKGKPVPVEDEGLAEKLRNMPNFQEVKTSAKKPRTNS